MLKTSCVYTKNISVCNLNGQVLKSSSLFTLLNMGNGSLFLKILPSKQNDIFWTMEKVVSKLDAYKTNGPLLSG